MLYRARRSRADRRGAAAVEFAILLPFLAFLLIVAVDFSRVYYDTQILNNCARNGALYGCNNPTTAADSAGIQSAALADASNLSPAPTVNSTTGKDDAGPYVEVSVSYTFQTLTNYPGIPSTTNLTRKVRMRVTQVVPNFNGTTGSGASSSSQ
jgi:Flp pilus assembly protein TadG